LKGGDNKMKKVFVYGLTETFGGVEKIILDYIKHIDTNMIQFDFVGSSVKPKYLDSLKNLSIKYHQIPKLSSGYNYFNDIYTLAKKEQYDIAYCNLGFSNALLIVALKKAGVKKIIVHSHNTMIDSKSLLKRYMLLIYHKFSVMISNNLVDEKRACSRKAYRWMFNSECKDKDSIINNAIEVDRYQYSKVAGDDVKKSLFGSAEYFVMGHIGRYTYQKNHEFLIDIFAAVYEKNHMARLLLVGDGELLPHIKQKLKRMNLDSKVCFIKFSNDIPKLLWAMDCFVLPSRFEGLVVVGIEAQASGLPCFISDSVTEELKITRLVNFLSLKESPEVWANKILSFEYKERENMKGIIDKAHYNINIEAERFYDLINY
jgi:glycosyltransferase involved in cell wall biosynthesis